MPILYVYVSKISGCREEEWPILTKNFPRPYPGIKAYHVQPEPREAVDSVDNLSTGIETVCFSPVCWYKKCTLTKIQLLKSWLRLVS